jgi:acyl-CoA reductase-like NAD-dependent aldehyde dehydrogenase
VGARLVSHDGVALVGMTGSSQTGSRIMESCARGLKRLVLELGGKDPMIVFGDADLDLAAKDAVSGSYGNAGQVCCAVERVYVDGSVRDEFAAKVLAEARQWVAGPGLDARSKLGPLVSSHQRATVHRHVQAAKAAGATVALGGTLPPESDPGYFYPATVLLDVPHDAVREETFGPVVSLTTFDGSESNACRLANDSEYGLSASVYTSDATKAARVGRALRAGQVGLNCYAMDNAPPECPWVGHKRSGFGYHSGTEGWRQFSTPKSLIALPGVEVASGAEPIGGGEQARSMPSAGAPAHAQQVGGGLGGRAGQWLPIAAALAVGVVLGVSMARRR